MKLTAVPETTAVYLPSEGLNKRRTTLHIYHHSDVAGGLTEDSTNVKATAHFYRCTETGALRRWGFDG